MRTSSFTALLLLVLAAVCATPGGSVSAAAPTDFLSWAHARSDECDLRWSRIADAGSGATASSLADSTASVSEGLTTAEKTIFGSKLSHSIISSRSFVHSVESNAEYLPLSTRERESATRGTQMLRNPAQAHLAIPYDVKRPLNSSVQQKKFIRSIGDVSRPRLNSFGRISQSSRLYKGAVARPACRGARPRIL
jgi:hypothetical protein